MDAIGLSDEQASFASEARKRPADRFPVKGEDMKLLLALGVLVFETSFMVLIHKLNLDKD